MAHPWVSEQRFDDGTLGTFDTETDASSILDFPHYSELARQGLSPWSGAYCVRLRLNGTAVAELVETGSWDLLADGTLRFWFTVCIGADLTLANTDTVVLFSLDSAGPVREVSFGVRNNAGVYELFAGETGATRTLPITRSNARWYQIELDANIDSGVPNDGTLDFYVDGAPVGAQITGLNQEAITQGRYGAVVGTAAGNAGTILLGPILADDLRLYPRRRFPGHSVYLTQSQHAFIGSGWIERIALRGTSADSTLVIYDTDRYFATSIDEFREPIAALKALTNNQMEETYGDRLLFSRGCYVALTGTNPEAWVTLAGGSVVQSHGGYVNRGVRR